MIKKIGQTQAFEGLLDRLDKRRRYVKKEHQAFGLEIAQELDDWKNRSFYIKLARDLPRNLLVEAINFIKDQPPGKIKSRPKLFMWKLEQLKKPDGKS